jgi:hypothetical protein
MKWSAQETVTASPRRAKPSRLLRILPALLGEGKSEKEEGGRRGR